MFMIQTFSKPTFVFTLLLCVATGAHAQERLTWPKTFSGQPDFDFTRTDVVQERQEKAQDGEDILATQGTWKDIIPLKQIDPFFQETQDNASQEAQDKFVGIDLSPVDDTAIVPDEPAMPQLPTLAQDNIVDASEFRTFLESTIDKTVRTAPPHFDELNVRAEIGRLTVQTISTSPVAYAMINGRRYTAGSTLHLPVYLLVRTEDIIQAVDAQMPNATQLGKNLQKKYASIRDEVIKDFTDNRRKRTNLYRAKHMLPIHITAIHSRGVDVEILGKSYDLVLR